MPKGATYPIFREEPLEHIYNILKENEKLNNEEINQEPNENVGSFFISNFNELDIENQQLFNEITFNFLRNDNIDGRDFLELIEKLENQNFNNEEKEA